MVTVPAVIDIPTVISICVSLYTGIDSLFVVLKVLYSLVDILQSNAYVAFAYIVYTGNRCFVLMEVLRDVAACFIKGVFVRSVQLL